MKKLRIPLLSAIAALTIFAFFFPATAFAEQATVTGSEVNVRSGPGMAFSITGSLKRGTVVEVLNRSSDSWYQVSWGSGSGYISSAYLQLEAESGTASVTVSQDGVPGYIDGMYVSLRSGPGTTYSIIGTYSSGKLLTIIGSSGAWKAVTIDGKEGYVFGTYVAEGSPNAAVIETENEAKDPYGGIPVPSQSGSSSSSGTTFIVNESKDAVQPENGASSNASSVTGTTPPQSADTAESSPVSGTLPGSTPSAGAAASSSTTEAPSSATATLGLGLSDSPSAPGSALTDDSPGQSASGEQTGTNAAAPQPVKSGIITGNFVRFRKGPGTTYSIINTYNRGTALTITGAADGWTAVTIDGTEGYVFSDYVLETASGEDTPTVAETVQQTLGLSSEQLSAAEVRDGYVSGNGVRLREAPSMTAKILTDLNNGTALKITGFSGTWTKVICNGQEGFIASDYVREGAYEPEKAVTRSLGSEPGKEIATYALTFVGSPYSWGGNSPATGFDCSGFVQYIFSQYGYTTSRIANDVLADGKHVDPADLQPGDVLCFYSGNGYVGHVGIYVGDETFVHAANSVSGVVTTSLSTGYYATRGYEIRRIVG